jgi:hypothetical protein
MKMFLPTLLALSLSGAAMAETEILQPFTDDMAEALGMTAEDDLQPLVNANSTGSIDKAAGTDLSQVISDNRVVVVINKAIRGTDAQTLKLFENGVEVMKIKVSTGKEERVVSTSGRTYVSTTPVGFYRPTKMYTDYLSYTWNAPMPNAVFFIGGIAIHATGSSNYAKLGTRASGGCVRTTLADSKKIRELVMESGKGSAPGNYVIAREAAGRNIIRGNSLMVPAISKATGLKATGTINSWETVIHVHE